MCAPGLLEIIKCDDGAEGAHAELASNVCNIVLEEPIQPRDIIIFRCFPRLAFNGDLRMATGNQTPDVPQCCHETRTLQNGIGNMRDQGRVWRCISQVALATLHVSPTGLLG